jgi:hypothetical protein
MSLLYVQTYTFSQPHAHMSTGYSSIRAEAIPESALHADHKQSTPQCCSYSSWPERELIDHSSTAPHRPTGCIHCASSSSSRTTAKSMYCWGANMAGAWQPCQGLHCAHSMHPSVQPFRTSHPHCRYANVLNTKPSSSTKRVC